MNQDHDDAKEAPFFIGCGAVLLFAVLLGLGTGLLISMVIK